VAHFQILYVAVFAGTAFLALTLAWVLWKQRQAFQATAVVALMLGVAGWCAAEAAVWLMPTQPLQVAMIRLVYVGASVVAVSYLVFALQIAGMRSWLVLRSILVVSFVPVLMCVLVVLNPGGLAETSYEAEVVGSYTHYVARYGPLLWVYIGVNCIVLLVSFGLVARAFVRSEGVDRAQRGLVLFGSLMPLIVIAENQLGSLRVEGLEAAAFFVTGVFYVFAIARGTVLDASGGLVTAGALAEANTTKLMLDTANVFLASEFEEAQLEAHVLYDQATRDPLTGLYNRRAMNEYLAREMGRFLRTGEPVALLMLDVDQLKEINDTLSHSAGDVALVSVADTLLMGARSIDVVCRLGGDEFVIIMSGADATAAAQRAEELCGRIKLLTAREDGRTIPLSVSIGVAAAPSHGSSSKDLMAAADRALHQAKQAGRSRVEVAEV
jgi:diguanylate cyclase (GGDEF)-like protein